MDAEAEKRKGFTLAIEGEPIHLPLVYGFQKIAGVRTFHNTTASRSILAVQSGFERFRFNLTGDNATASTNVYLWVQQAMCFGGIDSVIDVEVDGMSWESKDFSHLMDFSLNGNVANATGTANGIPATNAFPNVAYMTGVFGLNRDDPNYNGVPEVSAYVRGNRVHSVVRTGDVYSLSATKAFSNNPSLVLLDYLIREKTLGGCGYDVSEVNLQSFYDAAAICDTVVASDVQVVGRINGVKPVEEGAEFAEVFRDIRLYECNLTIDTNETRRDNIEKILDTMAQSELVWSEGRYKLVLDYPASETAQNALITRSYTDDDIVNSSITVTWAGVQDKFNRATVKFLNEEQDFATDSVSFPPYGSTQHQSYLADDNGVENEVQYFLHGATHRRSAIAKAEEMVRNSRISKTIDIELNRNALVHEQGDLIRVSSESCGIDNEVYRIEEIVITPNLTVKISAVRFDYETLAYNVSDTTITNPKTILPSGIPNVAGLAWNSGSRVGELSNGWLSWDVPEDETIRRFVIWYRETSGQWITLGETIANYFDIPAELNSGTDYYFLVRSENNTGRLSDGSIILLDSLPSVVPLTGATATAGINSVRLTWTDPNPQLAVRYDIFQGSSNVRASAVRVASTTSNSVVVAPLEIANYYFWVDVIGLDAAVGSMTTPVFVSALTLGVQSNDIPEGAIGWTNLAQGVQDVIDGIGNQSVIDAAEFASEAANSAVEAETSRAAAGVFSSDAAAAATDAEDAAAAAQSSKEVVARLTGGSEVANAIFTNGLSGFVEGNAGGSSSSVSATGGRYAGYWQYNTGASLSGSAPFLRHTLTGRAAQVEAIEFDIEVELLTGAWGSAQMRATWLGSPTTTSTVLAASNLSSATGVIQRFTGVLLRPANAALAGSNDVQVAWIANDPALTPAAHTARIHRFNYNVLSASASALVQQRAIADINGNLQSSVFLQAKAGTGGAELELASYSADGVDVGVARISADSILLDGTVTAEKLNVDWLNAGRISAEYLDVNTLLTIGEFAGLRYGKVAATSDELDGIYFGRDTTEFGFAASRTSDNRRQGFKLTSSTGLQFFNARHFVSGQTPPLAITRTTNLGRTALPAGTSTVKFTLTGGGAAGACVQAIFNGANTRFGQQGNPTVARLYDGSTLVATYTADGAPQTPGNLVSPGATAGQLSTLDGLSTGPGAGGAGTSSSWTSPFQGGSTQTRFSQGGAAGLTVTTTEIDVSGLANPQIEIDVGLGGVNTDVPAGYSVGFPGVNGRASYTTRIASDIPADVVPVVPSFVGSFTKAANATGGTVFPNLGPGIWVLNGNGLSLSIGTVEVADLSTHFISNETTATFVASKRPIITTGVATARTINYLFYSMTQWG